jgi:hypothetical protein
VANRNKLRDKWPENLEAWRSGKFGHPTRGWWALRLCPQREVFLNPRFPTPEDMGQSVRGWVFAGFGFFVCFRL